MERRRNKDQERTQIRGKIMTNYPNRIVQKHGTKRTVKQSKQSKNETNYKREMQKKQTTERSVRKGNTYMMMKQTSHHNKQEWTGDGGGIVSTVGHKSRHARCLFHPRPPIWQRCRGAPSALQFHSLFPPNLFFAVSLISFRSIRNLVLYCSFLCFISRSLQMAIFLCESGAGKPTHVDCSAL